MEKGFLQNWPRISRGQRLQFRKRLLLFSVFLLISVFIWFLNALSKNYTTEIGYPLEYEDMPPDRVFVGDPPPALDLRVSAAGYSLLRYKVFRKPVPISFNVSAFTLNRPGQDSSRAYILTLYLRDQIARQLPAELQLLGVTPDTLHFHFARKVTRRLGIRPDFDFEIDPQFTLRDGIVLDPDSVEVSGPDAILDTLRFIPTVPLELGLLTRDYKDKVRLKKIGDLEYGQNRVNCVITLEKFTEVQVRVPVEVINLPDSLAAQTFPSSIRLTCTVGLSNYDRLNNHVFRAVVDYGDAEGTGEELKVAIPNVPGYLLDHDFYPRSVEYLITRR